MAWIEDIIPLYDIRVEACLPECYSDAEIVSLEVGIDAHRSRDRLSFVTPEVRGHTMVAIGKQKNMLTPASGKY